jgi:ABC-2 type transport system permease protein
MTAATAVGGRAGANRPPGGRVWTALHAEWTKLRTVAAPGWLSGAAVVLTVGLGVLVAGSEHCAVRLCSDNGTALYDTTKIALSGVQIGQAVVAVLAVLAVGGEYGTGMIRTTLAAVPRRGVVLAAKAAVVAGVVLVVAALGSVASVLLAQGILHGHGFTAAHGYAALSLTDASTLRAAGGSALYLTLIALLAVGVTTAIRDSAVSIGTVLGLLFLFPILSSIVSDPTWARHLRQISPSEAGMAVQATVGVHTLPIGPWAGLGVAAVWAAGALLLGWAVFRFRDA